MILFYRFKKSDGLFTGAVDSAESFAGIAGNEDDNIGLIEGVRDWQSERVDLETGQIIDYQPPAPDDDHEWLHDDEQGNRIRRWVLKPEAAERNARQAAAQTRIAELAQKTERAVREHILGIVPTDDDRAAGALTLQEIQDEIAAQRAIINATDSSAT